MDRELKLISSLAQKTDSKIVLLVMDGLGDVSYEQLGNKTPLEAARTPNLDMLAGNSALGLLDPVMPGVTPGSNDTVPLGLTLVFLTLSGMHNHCA